MDRSAPPLTPGPAPAVLRSIPTIDERIDAHAAALGEDLAGYRNHAYRVANFCAALAPAGPDVLEKIAVAVSFHDLGIWTARTFDYLAPSIALATEWLERRGRGAWVAEVACMIDDHHKLSAVTDDPGGLVEAFRRADWIDVLGGLRSFGLPRRFIRSVRAEWPDAGFHARLLQLAARRLLSHPLSPLPMLKR